MKGRLYTVRSKSAVDMAAVTTTVITDVGDAIELYRKQRCEFVNETFATISRRENYA